MTIDIDSILDSRNFFENAKPSTTLDDIQKKFRREQYVLELKEELGSKKEVLARGVTEEEYNKYKGESLFHYGERRFEAAARMMHLAVSAEGLN